MASMQTGRAAFLGFDFSTQQIKCIATNDSLQLVYQNAVKFDTDLTEFRTEGGVHMHDDKLTVTAPTIMWVKALDLLLDEMKNDGFDFSSIKALSGAGQQHGSVYWKKGARQVLQTATSTEPLHQQLKDQFSIADSPLWMDSSTTQQCREVEKAVGGPQALANLTGAQAFERFTGPQIAKISQHSPDAYSNTERISLVSSFAASLFLGDYASIDLADGSGMNLLDITMKDWSDQCVQFCGKGLREKIGPVIPAQEIIGSVSSRLVDGYGFSPECQVVTFTGDNPASMAGMKQQQGDIMVSLGTSDTVVLWLSEARPNLLSCLSINCLDPQSYMGMLVYKNGSLTREAVQAEHAEGSWRRFSDYLNCTQPGNDGQIGIFFDVQEITPHAIGVHRFNNRGEKVKSFSPESEVRAVIEGQFLAKRLHAQNLGLKVASGCRLLATGGASSNLSILQVLADVFGGEVYTLDVPNSACLGSAYRAKHGYLGGETSFSEVVKNTPDFVCAVKPNPDATKVYDQMVLKYEEVENAVLGAV